MVVDAIAVIPRGGRRCEKCPHIAVLPGNPCALVIVANPNALQVANVAVRLRREVDMYCGTVFMVRERCRYGRAVEPPKILAIVAAYDNEGAFRGLGDEARAVEIQQ